MPFTGNKRCVFFEKCLDQLDQLDQLKKGNAIFAILCSLENENTLFYAV